MAIKKTINIDVQTQAAQKNVEKLGDTINNETKEIKGSLSGITGMLDKISGGMVTKFNNLKGSLGGVAGGFKSMGIAIAASGIGLLVTVIATVTSAFKSSEAGQNKFSKLMGVIGSVVGNLNDVLSDFGEKVIEAFENPRKAWEGFKDSLKTGYEFIKGQVIDRFSSSWTILTGGIEAGILKMRVKWNEFTGDAKEAEQLKTELKEIQAEVKAATEVINQRNQEIINGFNAAIAKVKEFGAEIAADAKKAQAIADQRAAADKKERNLLVARARADRDIADLKEKAVNKEIYGIEERIKFLEKAGELEQAITNREIEAAQLRLSAKQAENALSKSTKEDLDEEAQLKANLIQLDTARLTKQKEITAQTVAFRQEEKAARDAELAAREAEIEKEKEIELKRLNDIQTIRDEFKQKIEDLDAEDEEAKLELEEERKLAELEALGAEEEQKLEVRKFYEKLRTDIEKEQSDQRIQNALAEKESKARIFQSQADLAIQFGQLLQQIGEENKAVAIAGIIVEQVASAAKIVSATGLANAQAVATSPTTFGMPWVAINSISAGLSIASGVASAAKAISKLGGGGGGLQSDNPLGGSGGGGAAQPQPPSFNLVGHSSESQLAQTLNSRSNQPIKAYVVSKEVSSEQELDRNITATASIG